MKKVVRKLNRVLSVLLTAAMVAGSAPQTSLVVRAEESGAEATEEITLQSEESSAAESPDGESAVAETASDEESSAAEPSDEGNAVTEPASSEAASTETTTSEDATTSTDGAEENKESETTPAETEEAVSTEASEDNTAGEEVEAEEGDILPATERDEEVSEEEGKELADALAEGKVTQKVEVAEGGEEGLTVSGIIVSKDDTDKKSLTVNKTKAVLTNSKNKTVTDYYDIEITTVKAGEEQKTEGTADTDGNIKYTFESEIDDSAEITVTVTATLKEEYVYLDSSVVDIKDSDNITATNIVYTVQADNYTASDFNAFKPADEAFGYANSTDYVYIKLNDSAIAEGYVLDKINGEAPAEATVNGATVYKVPVKDLESLTITAVKDEATVTPLFEQSSNTSEGIQSVKYTVGDVTDTEAINNVAIPVDKGTSITFTITVAGNYKVTASVDGGDAEDCTAGEDGTTFTYEIATVSTATTVTFTAVKVYKPQTITVTEGEGTTKGDVNVTFDTRYVTVDGDTYKTVENKNIYFKVNVKSGVEAEIKSVQYKIGNGELKPASLVTAGSLKDSYRITNTSAESIEEEVTIVVTLSYKKAVQFENMTGLTVKYAKKGNDAKIADFTAFTNNTKLAAGNYYFLIDAGDKVIKSVQCAEGADNNETPQGLRPKN